MLLTMPIQNSTPSRCLHMLNARKKLPPRLQVLYELFFLKAMNEEQASAHLHVDIKTVIHDKSIMMKSLKAAAI